jgi:ABC-2 type transport system permease protein
MELPRTVFSKLVLNETRIAWRQPVGLIMGLGLPVLLLVVFGSIPALSKTSEKLGGLSYFEISFPILLALTALSLSFIALPTRLAQYREQGILRRLSTTPVAPSLLLAAQVVVNLAIALVSLTILVVVGMTAFQLSPPHEVGYFLLGVLLTIICFFAIGLFISAIAKSTSAAGAIGMVLFYPMLLFSGIWVPREIMPTALRIMSDWSPMGAAVGSIQNAMQGSPVSYRLLLILVGYALVFGYLSVRYFKWE